MRASRNPRSATLVISFAAALGTPAFGADPPLTARRIATGFDKPVFLTAAPYDHGRLYVLEQNSGLIRVLQNGAIRPQPFLDLGALVKPLGEWGLLGLAFHPEYPVNGLFFVYYTREPDGYVVIARYHADVAAAIADHTSATVILVQGEPFANHNGGTVAFGPDGYLYAALGDGGGPGDPACVAQNLGFLLGKMIRIDVDGGVPYAIPPGNPFVGVPGARAEIWALGLRNPYRFSFDRQLGDVYIGDVGQLLREEIDVQPAGLGGLNYGWKAEEGDLCFGLSGCAATVVPCGNAGYAGPVHVYGHDLGCSVTGGYVYRGCALSGLQGAYFFGDYCSGRIWSLRFTQGGVSEYKERTLELQPTDGSTIDLITAFGEDAAGELHIVDHDGDIFRIDTTAAEAAVSLGNGKVGGNGLVPECDVCGLLTAGATAQLTLRDAPPARLSLLVASGQSAPMPVLLGTLVPGLPPLLTLPFVTSAHGAIDLPFPGGGGPLDVFAQWLIDDPGATAGVGFSNAIKITFQP